MLPGHSLPCLARIFLILLLLPQEYAEGSCDPLVPEYCLLPFPNSFYTVPSDVTDTGVLVNISSDSFPKDIFGRRIEFAEWNTFDGFSPFPSILAYFPKLSDKNLPPHWDLGQSLKLTSPTLIFDAQTGEIVAHFSELDCSLQLPSIDEHALMLWPSQRLKDSSRYIVVLKDLKDTSGQLVLPSPAFKALRDNTSTSDPDVESRRGHFEDIFSLLKNAGISRSSIQLAWDFTTASRHFLTKRLVYARDDAAMRVGTKGPEYAVTEVQDHYSKDIYRRIRGVMKVPLYMTSPLPGAHLVTDPDQGLPIYQSLTDASFTVLIPESVRNGSKLPARIVQFGHGLFSSQSEVEQSYLQDLANRYGYVLCACDYWGLSKDDVVPVAFMLALNISDFQSVPDRLTQGVINNLLLMKLMKGAFADDPYMQLGGSSIVDTSKSNYYGNSLGGIIGSVYMAASTDVTEGVLGVSGGPFGLLLPRSSDFGTVGTGLRILYPDPVDSISVISLMNMLWSRLGPGGYMSSITKDPLPGTPVHRVLLQYALGDAQVNILGLYSLARSIGAVMYKSNVQEQFQQANGGVVRETLFGFHFVDDDSVISNGSVALGFDYGAPPEPSINSPPNTMYDTHEKPRRTMQAQEQMDLFWRTRDIKNFCGGPCVIKEFVL